MSIHRNPPTDNVRRVRSFSGNLCGVITNKMGRVVQFESFGERSLLLRLERDWTVTDYCSQPETLTYAGAEGRTCHYTPDFVVWRSDGRIELHEVTLSARRSQPSARGREQAAQAVCTQRGWQYRVHTEQDLAEGTELVNLLRLYPYRVTAYAEGVVQAHLVNWLTLGTSTLLTALAAQLAEATAWDLTRIWGALFHEVWHGELAIDWQHPFFYGAVPAGAVQVWRERQGQ